MAQLRSIKAQKWIDTRPESGAFSSRYLDIEGLVSMDAPHEIGVVPADKQALKRVGARWPVSVGQLAVRKNLRNYET